MKKWTDKEVVKMLELYSVEIEAGLVNGTEVVMKRLTASAKERLLSKPGQYGIAYLVYHRSAAWGGGYGVDRMYLLPGGRLMEAFPERYRGFYSSREVPAKIRAENFARSLCRKYDIVISEEDIVN